MTIVPISQTDNAVAQVQVRTRSGVADVAAARGQILTEKQQFGSALRQASISDWEDFREIIGARAEALLDPYWDKRPSEAALAFIQEEWMDVLEVLTPFEIKRAMREFQALPKQERAAKPTAHDILAIAMRARPPEPISAARPPAPEPERKVVSKAAAADIMAQHGFAPKRFGG